MAVISVTAANVLAGANARTKWATAGVQITAGEAVYLDGSKVKLGDADEEAMAVCVGISLNGAEDGQPIKLITWGNLNPGGTVIVGSRYFCDAATPGGIGAHSDIAAYPASGDYVTYLGVGMTISNLAVQIQVSGVSIA